MNEILGPIYYTFATDHDEDCRGKNLFTAHLLTTHSLQTMMKNVEVELIYYTFATDHDEVCRCFDFSVLLRNFVLL